MPACITQMAAEMHRSQAVCVHKQHMRQKKSGWFSAIPIFIFQQQKYLFTAGKPAQQP